MSKAVKVENYTAEMTATVKADFAAGVPVAQIAEKVGKSLRSVVAKLSREGVYTKKAYVAKDGSKAETKAAILAKIAGKMGCEVESIGSLEAATKEALKAVFNALPSEVEEVTPLAKATEV